MTRQQPNPNQNQSNTLPIEEDEIFGGIPVIPRSLLRQTVLNSNPRFLESLPGDIIRRFPNLRAAPAPTPASQVVYDEETVQRRNHEIQRINQVFRCSNMNCIMSGGIPSNVGTVPLTRQRARIHSEVHRFTCVECGREDDARVFF
jgi:hypothetical protein